MTYQRQSWRPVSGAGVLIAFVLFGANGARVPAQGKPSVEPRENYRGRPAAPREVLVGLRPTTDRGRLRGDLDAEFDELVGPATVLRVRSRSRNVASMVTSLAGRKDIAYVEPNYIVSTSAEPNDPRFPELWGLENLGQIINGVAGVPGADIGAVRAWDKAVGSRNVLVGVVDTGVDYAHPDLAANVWSAPASYTVSVGGRTITCAAGTHGFNAITKTCDPFDDHSHGTHVSGTIGATAGNAAGVAGVNWLANVIALKFLGANGSGALSDAINAIEFAVQVKAAFPQGGANIRVLSNSWSGGGFSQALLDEINRANQSDMLFVAAAGNSSSDNDTNPAYPASYAATNIIAVAATDNQDALASFSNYGATSVHLGAPGVQILSTLPGGTYGYFSGTSMATPHVSGAAALLLSRCTLTTAAVKSAILGAVDRIPSLAGITITGGRLDVGRAVDACGNPSNAAPSISLTAPGAGTFRTPGSITLSANASDSGGSVSQVAFYAGTALIGVVKNAPFTFAWVNPAVGNYSITAVATDNAGATATSASTLIRVLPGPSSQPFGGTAAYVPGMVEAENFNEGGEGLAYHDLTVGNTSGAYRQTDVDIQTTTDVNGGYALGYVDPGEWLAYWISVVADATYTVDVRLASLGVGGIFHLEVDGIDVTGPIAVPDTGGWQTWQTVSITGVALTAGTHVLRFVADTKGPSGWVANVNYFRFSAPGVNAPPSVQLTSPASAATYTAPATVPLAATASDPDGSVTQVTFYAGSTPVGTDTSSPYAVSWANVPIGTYRLTAVATDNTGASTTSNAITIQVVAPPSSTPFGGTPAVIPGLVEAENFDDGGEGVAYHDLTSGNAGGQYRQTNVDIEATLDTGGGYSIGYVSAGEWLKYSVLVTASASYTLEARVASPSGGGMLHVELDTTDITGPLAIPNTGGWQTWRSIRLANIPLSAGPHVLRVAFDANGGNGWVGNFNYMTWSVTSPGNAPPAVQVTAPLNNASFTPPASMTISATATDTDGIAQVAFYVGSTLLAVDTSAPYSVSWTLVPAGDYTLTARALDNAGMATTSSSVIVHVVAATSPTPFGGTRAAVPGTVEAENFDDGGEGVAYHDSTAGNSGGQYRQTDVDIETTTDLGGGYSIGYVAAGEWLAYSINVAASGSYTLQARVASPYANGTFHVEIDGVNVTGALTMPNTGGWQIWQNVTRTGISLTAGAHQMRIVFDSAGLLGYVGNLNYIKWTQP